MGDQGEDKYFYSNYNYNKAHNELDNHVNMASVSLVLGLISIPMCFFLYTGIILGGLAIVFAILSKGTTQKLLSQAKKGILYGTLGIVIGYSVIAYNVHAVLTKPEYRQELNRMSEQINGVSFDDMLKELGVDL